MPNVTGLHKKGRGRPTLEMLNDYKEAVRNSPKLFDTEPFTVKKYKYPENVDIKDWLKWVFEFLILNTNVITLLDIYEDPNIAPTMSFVDTIKAHDENIENLLEQRIISKVLKGELKPVFAQALLKEKYKWDNGQNVNVITTDEPIEFNFG